MKPGSVDRIEAGVQAGAAAMFAGAVAFALFCGLPPVVNGVITGPLPAVAALAAYLLCKAALDRVSPAEKRYPLPIFDLRPVAPAGPAMPDELVLTDAERVTPATPAPIPTPGQLGAVIDRHLDGGRSHRPPADASQDLYAALAELRRELR